MEVFNPWLEVSATGIQSIGRSPHGSVSILSDGVVGTIGVFSGDNFKPHPDGAIVDGGQFTYDCGAGRELGIDVTSGTGTISTAKV